MLSRLLAFAIGAHPIAATAQSLDGVQARCGASVGEGYYFYDELFVPDGPEWSEERVSTGEIILIRLNDEWDILFDDAVGSTGYRQTGATVLPLAGSDTYLTVGAFGRDYVEIYTFNSEGKEVVWTSHKVAPIPKVSILRAECSFFGRAFDR